jgi:DNA polymerase-3 subunit delta'
LQTWVAELARVQSGAAPRFYPEQGARLETLARQTDLGRISELETMIRRLTRYAEHPLNPRLLCENALVAYCSLFEASGPR